MISAPVLSTLAAFDDLRRCIQVLTDGVSEEEFLKVLRLQEKFRVECLSGIQEAQRLQKELDTSLQNMADLETKLFHARRLLEMETKARREAENERDQMEKKITAVAEVMQNDRDLKEETRGKLAFLNGWPKKRKSMNMRVEEKYGNDINSTGSFLSDLSLTQSEDDFLDARKSKNWVKHRPSLPKNTGPYIGGKRSRLSIERENSVGNARANAALRNQQRKSGHKSNLKQNYAINSNDNNKHTLEVGPSEKIYATTKVTIPPDGHGPIRAESTIKTIPMDVDQCPNSSTPKNPNFFSQNQSPFKENLILTPTNATSSVSQMKRGLIRQHDFTPKTYIRTETCSHCQKKIRFGMSALRCRDCSLRCHADCRNELTISCVPQSGTPSFKGSGHLTDYAPIYPPLIPALIIHCVNEIEARGLNEVGLYRVSSTEREVKSLKERFLRGKVAPHLGNIDIHIICGCLKDFLRSLREPLIPTNLWKDFSNSVQNVIESEIQNDLFKAIDALPQANRDTLAFLILHFQRIAESPTARMPIDNISRVFGPTIVGYSSADPDQHAIFTETVIQFSVMQNLMKISSNYWTQFINFDSNKENTAKRIRSSMGVPQTPKSNNDQYSSYATPIKSTLKKRKFLTSVTNSSRK